MCTVIYGGHCANHVHELHVHAHGNTLRVCECKVIHVVVCNDVTPKDTLSPILSVFNPKGTCTVATLIDKVLIDNRDNALAKLGLHPAACMKDGVFLYLPWGRPYSEGTSTTKANAGTRMYDWAARVHDDGNGKPGARASRRLIMGDPVSRAALIVKQGAFWKTLNDERFDGASLLILDGAWVILVPVSDCRKRVNFALTLTAEKLATYDASKWRYKSEWVLAMPVNTASPLDDFSDPFKDMPTAPAKRKSTRKAAPVLPVSNPADLIDDKSLKAAAATPEDKALAAAVLKARSQRAAAADKAADNLKNAA